ncbi:mycothiol conjugate amidase Mca [Kineosporia sp. NBRC 101731]|uniref:mycothiol conjugate amidase Mca n=1 Tax=Kineosporia sp. NBRC 101731 TaxID=3032199 RepID=UPI0024A28586|nr:mycothiol conjugate amidase Mca [Kineosporia sp. NBRC 101731]GLY28621.1 mycothiol S-conjugate amidase [Kineosporia sp. NBRC 101731]
MAEQLRLMAVHAHPDDESSKGAATLARYVDEGVDVLVVSCTGGERGDVLNPKLQGSPEVERDLPELRRKEMATAAAALGVKHHWLGFVDSGLPEGDPLPPLPEGCFALQPLEVASAPLVRLVREFRPHVMTTYNELGGYPHPDHIMTHKVSVEAFEAAGDPTRYEAGGEPWTPLKLYYDVGFSIARMMAFHEALIAMGKESPFLDWMKRRESPDSPPERKITSRVNIVGWMDRRDAALRAHATQIDPDGWFFAIPNDVQANVWPTDDFELARSLVDTELPEDDLFAGIRDRAKV